MKIVFFNVWKGQNKAELTDFIEQNYRDTDIFCLQEANENAQQIFETFLIGYKKVADHKFVAEHQDFHQVIYIRQNYKIVSTGTLFMNNLEAGLSLFVQIQINDKNIYICNAHGSAIPFNKLDSPLREKISETLINLFKNKGGTSIIGGDFNLSPNTNSIRVFEEAGYRDLIKDYAIETTRNHIAWDRYPDNKQLYADYIFLDKALHINSFKVIDGEASDHLPLVLDVNV